MENKSVDEENNGSWETWLKRFGVAGFLFFLIKGLLWLIVPALLVFFGIRC
jgi:hypothetical protein